MAFILVAAAIYFFVVAPMNAVTTRLKKPEAEPAPALRECPECLSEIPASARRCKFCASARRCKFCTVAVA